MKPIAHALLCLVVLGAGCSSGGDGGGATGTGGMKAPGTGGSSAGTGGGSGAGTGGGTGSGTGGSGGGALTEYKTCTAANRVGRFTVFINNDADKPFSGAEGYVMDGVEPGAVTKEVGRVGSCVILQPPAAATCNPQCSAEQWCTESGCKSQPNPKDLGKVTVGGLKQALELRNLTNRYVTPAEPELMHPVFDEGAAITLSAAGAGGYGPFSLRGQGVGALEVPMTAIKAQAGMPVTLTWTPPAKGTSAVTRVHIKFAINLHGAVDTWFECEVPDTGSYTVSAELMTELFKFGVSGFPSVDLTRRSSDTTTVPSGCVEFMVAAPVNRPLEVPGVVSCQDDTDCMGGKKCSEDLTCK